MHLTAGKRRSLLGLIDQGIFSLSNFALTVLVAKSATATDFGRFAVIIATFLICSFVARGLTSETFVIKHASNAGARFARGSDGDLCAGAAFAVGIAAGAIVGCVGSLLGGVAPWVGLVLALLTPGIFLQDNMRYQALARGRPKVALGSDAFTAGAQALAYSVIYSLDLQGPAVLVAAWGTATWLGGIYACVMLRTVPHVLGSMAWFAASRALGLRYAVDNFVAQGTNQVVPLLLAGAQGVAAAGAFKAAQTIFGPMAVIFAGVMTAVTPELVRLRSVSIVRMKRMSLRVSLLVAAMGGVAGAVVLVVPDAVMQNLFGATWEEADSLVLWLALAQVPAGWRVGSIAGLRAMAKPRRTLQARMAVTVLGLGATGAGALIWGAEGAAIGVALSAPPQAAVWTLHLRRAVRLDEGAKLEGTHARLRS